MHYTKFTKTTTILKKTELISNVFLLAIVPLCEMIYAKICLSSFQGNVRHGEKGADEWGKDGGRVEGLLW